MSGGRKPLDPETKREHRQLSSALYEAKNADQQREAARLCMRRHYEAMTNQDYHTRRKYREQVAGHSEDYRRRKLQEELIDRCSADTVKRRDRKLEGENLRVSHQSAAKPTLTP
ncbi:hypothetical protein K438DRAFT_1769267 [Mycena galopus ATCC 62051]|nr:hypothetical protein K438DRAFT_1769267 [Mycena galopus ATCC 62051]